MAQSRLNVLVEWSCMLMVFHKKTMEKCEGNTNESTFYLWHDLVTP